jgi:hypothetical protein
MNRTSLRISARFNRFLSRIRPSREQFAEADRQVAVLKEQLIEHIAVDGQFYVEKIFRAGSTAKHTDLARTGDGTFDVDLGVYYRAQGYAENQLKNLLQYTRVRLREIYPLKQEQDFHLGKNAVNVVLRSTGLKVDVVPIVRDTHLKRKNSGWIPREDGKRLTSITTHIHFVQSRTARSKRVTGPVKFNHLVRLMKWWNRRLPESLRQCSYFCELITAAALEEGGVTDNWQSSLYKIFSFLSHHAFSEPIIFGDYYDPHSVTLPGDLVIVLDAVNYKNNVASKWDESIKRGYLKCVQQTFESIRQAQDAERKGDEELALHWWCQIFGDDFRRLSQ